MSSSEEDGLPSAQPGDFAFAAPSQTAFKGGLRSDSSSLLQDDNQDSERFTPPAPGRSEDNAFEEPSAPVPIYKHLGPNPTWRHRTAADREIWESLKKLQSQDLSVHLYNTHALRIHARAQREGVPIPANKKGKGKGKAPLKQDAWEPPKLWAAWPMPADEVPREVERIGLEPRPDEAPRNSRRDLEEIMLAMTTRLARERFEAREWESVDADDEGAPVSSPGSEAGSSASAAASDSPAENTGVSKGPQIKREASVETSYPTSTAKNASAPLRPVPLADDDTAAALLLPSVRRVMSQNLDRLFYTLHRTRVSYATDDGPASDESDRFSRASSVASSRPNVRSRRTTSALPSAASPQKRKRTKTSLSNESVPDADDDDLEATASATSAMTGSISTSSVKRKAPSRSQQGSNRRAKLGLRDWSDVLGLAAMQGWDADVIERTRQRCAALFGENMDFVMLRMQGASHDEERQSHDHSGHSSCGEVHVENDEL